MAGGTGGHIFPGPRGRRRDARRAAGTSSGWARAAAWKSAWCRRAATATAWIRAQRARGKGLAAEAAAAGATCCIASGRARARSSRIRPDVVLGLGGYVAFPGGMMASLLDRPLALHEQNAIAGLANRVLAGVADKVMAAFPDALKGAEWTGNPVRARDRRDRDRRRRASRAAAGRCALLVVGGSLGAQALNEALPKALALLPDERPRVVHQAGEKHLDTLQEQLRSRRRAGRAASPSSTTWRGATPRPTWSSAAPAR